MEAINAVNDDLRGQKTTGILIGYISDITVDSSNMTESAKLTPAVDFSKLDMVLIITKEKEAMY